MKKRTVYEFLIPVVVSLMFLGLNFTDFFKTIELRAYDQLLHLKKNIPQHEDILFLDIDDYAIARVGTFPWSRRYMAEGLLLMKEFGAEYALFDIEYVNKSPLGVDVQYLDNQIPQSLEHEFGSIQENVQALFTALQNGNIPLDEAQSYVDSLQELNEQAKAALYEDINQILRDNDRYLGEAAAFFENTFVTLNMLNQHDETVADDLKTYAKNRFSLNSIMNLTEGANLPQRKDIRPAILPILSGAKGAGFVNVNPDSDGVRRRLQLFMEYDGKYFPQLMIAPLLDWLGNPSITVTKNNFILNDAEMPDSGTVKDIVIPRSRDGSFLLNWVKSDYLSSFRHLSYYELVYHDKLLDDLIYNLELMEENGYFQFYAGDQDILNPYRYAENLVNQLLKNPQEEGIEEYIAVRNYFLDEVGNFLEGNSEAVFLDAISNALASGDLNEELVELYTEVKQQIPVAFSNTRTVYKDLISTRNILKKELENSFCIIGLIGASTTDIGVTPFEEEYMNVGTHGVVANSILQERFLDMLPWWYSLIAAFVLSSILVIILKKMHPGASILAGFIFLAIVVAAYAIIFLTTGTYLNVVTPAFVVFITFLVLSAVKFIINEKEKSYIRNAFSRYLSVDVINEIMDDPEMLMLGGQKKNLTALFTDVKGFSTISEQLDPQELVRLLNQYLSSMSDLVLQQRGTIDKFEGDAIISFFGAPINLEDHAVRACKTALLMKETEKVLNKRFIEENISPSTIHTRIGINTGEMVVGNMGTQKRMDYTIMGHAVNLAARLEGVNKQYGTWILCSELTYKETGRAFSGRKLDRIRVVGVSEPIRLYEIVGLREDVDKDQELIKLLRTFNYGLTLFEEKNWQEAETVFRELLTQFPDDGPTDFYLTRCEKFIKEPPQETWDGVFNLSVK
jgi:adenylate cyclase